MSDTWLARCRRDVSDANYDLWKLGNEEDERRGSSIGNRGIGPDGPQAKSEVAVRDAIAGVSGVVYLTDFCGPETVGIRLMVDVSIPADSEDVPWEIGKEFMRLADEFGRPNGGDS